MIRIFHYFLSASLSCSRFSLFVFLFLLFRDLVKLHNLKPSGITLCLFWHNLMPLLARAYSFKYFKLLKLKLCLLAECGWYPEDPEGTLDPILAYHLTDSPKLTSVPRPNKRIREPIFVCCICI